MFRQFLSASPLLMACLLPFMDAAATTASPASLPESVAGASQLSPVPTHAKSSPADGLHQAENAGLEAKTGEPTDHPRL
jgi:hypothetical protein